jgi:signal transduction histidine kinase/ligand-binding sensor domain-containing protein
MDSTTHYSQRFWMVRLRIMQGCRVRLTVLIAALILQMLIACQGLALDPRQPANSYLRADFTVEDGLPDNKVNAIIQTRNGFLWVGTDGGLARFDGEHFTPIRFKTGVSREIPVNSLLTTPDGDLWVGTDAGLARIPGTALDHFDRSLVTMYHPGTGLSDQITFLHRSRDGLWVGTSRGLYRLERGSFVSVMSDEWVSVIEESSSGHLLIVTGHGFVEWDGSQIIRHPELTGQLGIRKNEIFHVYEDGHGVIWFCTSAGVARRVNGSIQKLTPYGRAPMGAAYRVYEDRQGNVWSNTGRGFFRAGANSLEPVAPGLHARCMYSDVDGGLWVGTNNEGLVRFKDRAIRMYTTADGLPPGNSAMVVLSSHDGTLWVGNNCGGLSRFDGQRFQTYNEKQGMSNSCVWSMAEDADHNLWIGTWGGGLNRFGDGHFTAYSIAQGLPSNVVKAIVAAQDGSLWLATMEGLSHMQNGHFRNYSTADGLSSDRTLTVYQDREGTIWAGTSGGIDRLVGNRFVPVQQGPESADVPYGPLSEDSRGNFYALSLVNGISRIEENRLISVNETLQPSGMVESDGHDFWFCGRNGLLRVKASDLKRQESDPDSPLDYSSFGRSDGLDSKECSVGQPNMAMTPDGKLWVGTVKGLAMLDLRGLPHTNRKPAIFMEDVDVGRAKRAPGHELVLGPGKDHVELHFTAVDLASPENIRIQYRLDSVDSAWMDADSTRAATYTDIPVGLHSFHIRATNGDGVWDREGIVYNITQKPYFYETNVFRIVAITSGVLLLTGLYRFRLRQAAERLNARFDDRMAERNLLAGELHDTILQTVQATKMIADNARHEHAADPIRLREAMDSISDWLSQATTEARVALNSLRTSTTQSNDLAEAFERTAESSSVSTSMRFLIAVEGAAQDLHPIVRDEIYRIGSEAIRNACLHSGASELDVSLNYSQNLIVRVCDNGKGIDPGVATGGKPGHFGLLGMQERASRIHAKLRIMSRANSGTEVELVVPGNVVFKEPGNGGQGLYAKLKRFFHRRAPLRKPPAAETEKEGTE